MSFIIIPDAIKKSKEISSTSKLIYGDILSLSAKHGYCYANNEYFAKIYNISTRAVSKIIGQLLEFSIIDIKNNVCEFSKARQIVPMIFVDTEQKFEEVGIKVPRTKVLEGRNKSSEHIEQKFPKVGTKVQKGRNKSSNIIDNIKDNRINNRIDNKYISNFIFPKNFSPAIIRSIENFIEYRKEIKKPFKSDKSLQAKVNKWSNEIEAHGEAIVLDSIDEAIANGWQGTFIDMKKVDLKKQQPKKQEYEMKFNVYTGEGIDLTKDPTYVPELGF